MQYLLSALSGEALNLVKAMNISAANYPIAYQLLRDRYHNPRRLATLHLNALLDLPNISSGHTKKLRDFLNSFTEHTQSLSALKCDITTSSNPLLSAHLLRKLDQELRQRLEHFRSSLECDVHTLPTVNHIIQFLNDECDQTEDASLHRYSQTAARPSTSGAAAKQSKPGRYVNYKSHTSTPAHALLAAPGAAYSTSGCSPGGRPHNSQIPCFACNQEGHKIYSCTLFLNKTPAERSSIVKANKRCYSCLGSHTIDQCKSQKLCNTCHKKHHSLLHFERKSTQVLTPAQPSHSTQPPTLSAQSTLHSQPPSSLVANSAQGHSPSHPQLASTVLLGTALVKLIASNGHMQVLRCLIDSGSQLSFITERAVQLLNAPRTHSSYEITGISGASSRTKGQVYLDLKALSEEHIASHHPFHILDKISAGLPRTQLSPTVLDLTKPYVLADPTFYLPGSIDVLLGGALFPLIFSQRSYSLGQDMPYMVGTKFGFVVMGSAPCALNAHNASYFASLLSTGDHDLNSSLQRFWIQEETPLPCRKSQEEKLCDQHFSQTHSRTTDGRYMVRLPFKPDIPALGQSQQVAEKRFLGLERKLHTQPQLAKLYVEYMRNCEKSGYMTKVNDFNPISKNCFLPHHGVLKQSGASAKIRVVYDASCKTSNGTSLNDTLLTGPKLQTNICDLLLHFRTHNVVFTCDIRQMYLQILVHPADQDYQLILWRETSSEPLSIYRLTRVTFGVNCSPYLAIKTLHQLADDEGDAYPEAARILRANTYVDDIISGADTVEEVINLQNQLISLLGKGGFELRKWASNCKTLLKKFPQDHLETPVFMQTDENPHVSVLGLHWCPDNDCFSYKISIPQESPTKRTVLSAIARLYDPCGFLAPFIMLTKCFMQLLWTTGLTWDKPLTPDLALKWQTLISSISYLPKIKIPRCFKLSQECDVELHGFSDASESGFAAVIYFRCISRSGEVQVHQILAKTRVAPLKRVTLPRLELCGAHLLAQLASYCQEIFRDLITFSNTYLWSDSSIALAWLQTPPFRLKTFVANRVAQTQELFPSHVWHHVKSSHNPADCASRGILASDLWNHSLWWNGPPWLLQPKADWPAPQFVPLDLTSADEIKDTPLTVLTTTSQKGWDLFSRFSSYRKLQEVMARMLRFIFNCRHSPQDHLVGPLSLKELKDAELRLFQLVQGSAFSEEISLIKKGRNCSARLQRLSPFIDSKGLLRVGGRLKASSLSYDVQHPYLLPAKHPLVDLLIDKYHIQHLHAGPQLTQSLLTKLVWILSARSVIRSRIFKCVKCFRAKPRNKGPLMGDLPRSRVTPARPFLSTGVDYCGPFMVKVHTLRAMKQIKVYLCIFICMVTKAVHLEVATDLTTEAFIGALTRFVSRRGLCSHIYSDCGTNFVGADAALRKIVDTTIRSTSAQETISQFTIPRKIQFHFNPPAAPHQGGLWESAVRGAKYHLRRVMGNTVLTLAEFMTLTTQVEAMLNSRPLTPLSSDPSDVSALTPGHFLIGGSPAAVPEQDFDQVSISRLRRWQLVQALHQRIWKRWQAEYLHCLQQRVKWSTNSPDLKVGDLVLLETPSSPLSWPLARIEAVHPGADGVVRVVTLRTTHGTFTRPAVKVFPLPLN